MPAARRQFGNVALLQEDSRQAWGWARIEAWLADVKYAARGLRRNPAFAAVAVLTLALGIGATTAVFSVVHAVVLRPLPYANPERIVTVWETREHSAQQRVVVSYPIFRQWKQSPSFEHMAAWDGNSAQIIVGGEPVEIPGADVSGGFFETFGIQPMMGRVFAPDEEKRSAPKVAILSYALWQRLGADGNVVGKPVKFDRQTFTIVGVMPKGFAYPANSSEIWFPFAVDDPRNDGAHYLKVVGRLRPGIPVSRAMSEIQTIAARLPEAKDGIGAIIVPMEQYIVGETRTTLMVAMGAAACVFLIACANVASLLIVRAAARRREMGMRLALGAGRWRIARCLLAESVLLAIAGSALGIPAAYFLVRGFVAIDPIHLPRVDEVAVHGRVLVYAIAAAIATGILFGLTPALRAAQTDALQSSRTTELGANRGRSLLAAAQIAMSVMLLVGAGLLLRSFVARLRVPLGFRPEGTVGVDLPWSANRRIDELLGRLRVLPGVIAAGAATTLPQNPAPYSCESCVEAEGHPRRLGGNEETGLIVATPGYFEAAGLVVLSGRGFTPSDGPDAQKVVVVSEALVRRDFGGENPVGRRVRQGGVWLTVVGVVADLKGYGAAGEARPDLYFPNRQTGWYNPVAVLVRTGVPPAGLRAAVRKEIRAWNARILIKKLDTQENLMSSAVAAPRFYLVLIAGFAALALLVSAVGVYGTVNYSVARRTHEIGIRMALGARRGAVAAMVLRQSIGLTAAGLVLGLAGAWISTRVLEKLLFGVRPTDALAFACGSGVLVVTVLLASYIPARRATRVDPLDALRHE